MALERVRSALQRQPLYLAGTGRFDTDLIVATDGNVVGKGGAEGVHGDALLDRGAGLALKVIDGNRRAVSPAAIALLDRAGALDANAKASLSPYERPIVRNVAGRPVGFILADPTSEAHS